MKIKCFPLAACLVCCCFFEYAFAQETVTYTLQQMVDEAKAKSPTALRALTRKENRYWQYRLYRSNYNPQLRLTGTIPNYYQEFNPITQEDGSIAYVEQKQNLLDVGLGLQQVIAPTGGMISVNTSATRLDNFRPNPGLPKTQYSGVPVNILLQQPLFAYNPYKWDKKIQPLVFEESKREYVNEMEDMSVFVSQMYFDYLIAQVNYEIASVNLKNTGDIYAVEKKRYEMGVTYEDALLQIELQVLTAKQELAEAKMDLERAAFAVTSFVGLPRSSRLNLVSPADIPEFDVNVDHAIDLAFQNRAEAIGFDRQKLEAEAEVARAKGERFQVDLRASYGYNNADYNFGGIYQNPVTQALVNLGVSVPILDWGRNKARMSQAKSNQRLVEYTVEQERLNFEQEIFTKVNNFLMIKERLNVTKVAADVGQRRYDIALNRYRTGNVTITDLNVAQNEKDANKRAYYSSLRDYWVAYFELRALTLYDFKNDVLLYKPEVE